MVYDRGLHEYHKSERLRGYREALGAHGFGYDEGFGALANFHDGRVIEIVCRPRPRPTRLFAAGYGTGLAAMTEFACAGCEFRGHCFCDVLMMSDGELSWILH